MKAKAVAMLALVLGGCGAGDPATIYPSAVTEQQCFDAHQAFMNSDERVASDLVSVAAFGLLGLSAKSSADRDRLNLCLGRVRSGLPGRAPGAAPAGTTPNTLPSESTAASAPSAAPAAPRPAPVSSRCRSGSAALVGGSGYCIK